MPISTPCISFPQALVIINGANVSETSYVALAQTFADMSPEFGFNLFVAVPKPVIPSWPDPITTPRVVASSVRKLMKLTILNPKFDVYVAGHSLGGVFLKDTEKLYAGFLMFASYVQTANFIQGDWTKPTLHISGERDGQMRMSRIAVLQKDLSAYMEQEQEDPLKFPFVVIPVGL